MRSARALLVCRTRAGRVRPTHATWAARCVRCARNNYDKRACDGANVAGHTNEKSKCDGDGDGQPNVGQQLIERIPAALYTRQECIGIYVMYGCVYMYS